MTDQTYAGGGVEKIPADAVNSGANRPLYAARVKIFPKSVDGFYRRMKWAILIAALAVYWITPWIRWDRGPSAPDQAVLVDLGSRRFYFFFIEIWPQEFYYVAGLLIMAGLGLFLITSVLGRAWCGYACPQTVWTDLYMWVERLVEGDRNARMRLEKAPWTFEKVRKRGTVHALWLLIAVATGGAWVFYFADAPTLLRDLVTLNAAPVAYTTIGILTATTYIFAGFMREQVCTYMCPWPRIQGAMLDEDSLIVTYNAWRGEPRTRGQKKAAAQGLDAGDCIDCNACVAVCPMGIDIRDGQQLECITCALCIDACNDVMTRIDRPRELIGYTTLRDYEAHAQDARKNGRAAATADQRRIGVSHIVRPRTMLYFALWSMIGLAMVFGLATRGRLDVNVLPDRNPLFVTLSDGAIRNGYTVKVLNMQPELRSFTIGVEDLPNAHLRLAEGGDNGGDAIRLDVEPDRLREIKVFVSLPREDLSDSRQDFRFVVRDLDSGETARAATRFHGPEQ
ncbi:cytochrome c oxidase accessory protein CcoG [Faunimonas sp. B44]|uniref:cytochrome c oxidase accessory protein CcoG n=1 Tax=Faunimonas sp. B44 TaxID=3461493 RepID=UPI0040450F4E